MAQMIMIPVNRYTIMMLEEAIEKFNKGHEYRKHEYHEMIDWLAEEYNKEKPKKETE